MRKRTDEYNRWVDAFAGNRRVPLEWAEHGVRKEDYVRPSLRCMERRNRFGVYFILKSMEVGLTFRSSAPKYPVADPDYRIIGRQRCRYTHYTSTSATKCSVPCRCAQVPFLPFQITYYLNGHHFIERELIRRRIGFRKDDNAFLAVDDPKALQAAATGSAPISSANGWITGHGCSDRSFPARTGRRSIFSRHYSIQQVEYCRNLIFRRHFPIHKLFENGPAISDCCDCCRTRSRRSSDSVFHKRLRGKLQSVLEKVEHGHPVFRACGRSAVLRMHEKVATFLRLEALSNNLKDVGLRKSLDNLDAVRKTLAAVTDRLDAFEAEALKCARRFPLFSSAWRFLWSSGRSRSPESKSTTPA